MSKNKRRIEITAFRRQRLAITGAVPEPPVQPTTTAVDEDLAEAIRALVKQLTSDTLGGATIRVSQNRIGDDGDQENEAQ
jgi:hypothetical protein